jgi:hypothetical protein
MGDIMLSHEPSIRRSDLTHTELNTLIAAVPRERHLSFLIDAETTAATFCRTLLGEETGNAHYRPQHATDLGVAVLRLLKRLHFLIEDKSGQHRIINALALSIGLWVAKRHGEIREMGLIVNGLTMAANGTLDRCELDVLYEVSLHTPHAAEAFLKADIDKHDDHRPWRLLCHNHSIISTRSGNGELANASYDLLITHLYGWQQHTTH